jgi:hypothetical protein
MDAGHSAAFRASFTDSLDFSGDITAHLRWL